MNAGLVPGHPDDNHLARCVTTRSGCPDRRERAIGVLALFVAGHDDNRASW